MFFWLLILEAAGKEGELKNEGDEEDVFAKNASLKINSLDIRSRADVGKIFLLRPIISSVRVFN